MDWQPIETAPKDGTRILAYWPADSFYAHEMQCETWFGQSLGRDCWQSPYEDADDSTSPTHWMPLPEPPK